MLEMKQECVLCLTYLFVVNIPRPYLLLRNGNKEARLGLRWRVPQTTLKGCPPLSLVLLQHPFSLVGSGNKRARGLTFCSGPGSSWGWLTRHQVKCPFQLSFSSAVEFRGQMIIYYWNLSHTLVYSRAVNHREGKDQQAEISFLQLLQMLRGCEMNNYSLCIKYSLFHQPQSAQLWIFFVLLLVKVFGHNCHSSSPHCL